MGNTASITDSATHPLGSRKRSHPEGRVELMGKKHLALKNSKQRALRLHVCVVVMKRQGNQLGRNCLHHCRTFKVSVRPEREEQTEERDRKEPRARYLERIENEIKTKGPD